MSLFSQIDELQWKQLQHDEKYHKDIWLLSVQQRITHMTLHVAKYSAKLTIAAFENDSAAFKKAAIDCFIIIISSANIFNFRLYDEALTAGEYALCNLKEVGKSILESQFHSPDSTSLDTLSRDIVLQAGKMCKATESLDHLEPFLYRQSITESLGMLFRTTLAAICYLTNEEIESLLSERLTSIEKKNIFFDRLGNYETGYLNVLERR